MRDTGNYLKVIYSFSATIDKLRKTDITLDCGVTINIVLALPKCRETDHLA